ncbi:Heterokaryon incompatibility [Akanthomyces lecanii RCEF 1005]|uniref:Heterokaryon incompatibility n=1 Tax=Akanthomyces lecanii RCEF 1005 TaxID=1081108 RepID=A0A168IZF7_CORDF|nr:Heterokaryon incompatibility [Akanthomyces lecanii RCEF 1005]
MPQDKYDCETCSQLWRMLTKTDFLGPIDLGSKREAASTSCQDHGPLVREFCELLDRETADVGFVRLGAGSPVTLIESIENMGVVWDLLLVAKDSVPSHPGNGRILNPGWADLEVVTKWKNACLTTHGSACDNPMKIPYTQPEFLIDVEQKCIVHGSDTESRFIALSYVWGEHRQKIMVPATRARLLEPNSLSRPDFQEHLPPVIEHAMQLTSRIGERYLWVDALCIDQADAGHTKRQLQAMAAIYSSAIVTIISADGDSNVGIPGLQGSSAPREQRQRVFQFGDEQICVRNTSTFFLSWSQKYFDRGWTYQENELASRRIIFLSDEVHWQCQCSIWHEELTLNTEVDAYINPRLRTIMAGFPDLGSLSHSIGNYNQKTLTYEEDALPAISGLLSTMSRSFTGGFLFGLPEMFFEQSLGWQPYWSHTNLQRRISSARPAAQKLMPCDLPSWSWIGWQGHVKIRHDAARINPREHNIRETFAITEWFCGQSPTDPPSKRRQIRSTWYEQRAARKDFTQPLPEGWTRHSISTAASFRDEPALHPAGCGEYVFRHPAMCDPDTIINDWHYPFPLADIQPLTPPFRPEQWPYLFCKTQSVHLWAHAVDKENVLSLCDSSGAVIGDLHLHNEESLAMFPSELPGRELELVALYKSTTYSKTFSEEKQRYDLPVNITDTVCLLWIEWENGVAFRRACGSVLAGEWAKLSSRDIDLVLG